MLEKKVVAPLAYTACTGECLFNIFRPEYNEQEHFLSTIHFHGNFNCVPLNYILKSPI